MVIAILTVIVGGVTIVSLPVAQFPNIVPPEIQLQASYVGADAQALEQSVATPIEQQINGVDNVNYMYSLNATGNSQTTMVVDFDLKTDPNTDLILTQSREQLAAGQLPADVNTYGVTIRKSGAEVEVMPVSVKVTGLSFSAGCMVVANQTINHGIREIRHEQEIRADEISRVHLKLAEDVFKELCLFFLRTVIQG